MRSEYYVILRTNTVGIESDLLELVRNVTGVRLF